MIPLNTTPTNKVAMTVVATSRMAEAEAEVDTNVEVAEVVAAAAEAEEDMEVVVAPGITRGIPQETILTWTLQPSKTW